tara:strand:+ start:403 stop:1308 length:906 start_codon:yes stop_codon:yes gene_type:complete
MINSCVIGLSKIGQIHCKNLIKLKKTVLTHVYDKNFKLSNKIAKKFRCKNSKNFDQLLKKNIKLFIIASPTTTHEYYIEKLTRHNKIIYCEKPILNNNNNLNKIIELIKKKNIKFCVGLNRRFSKEYLALKKRITRKKIKIIQITSKSANHDIRLSLRNGGLFFDKGFHFFDLACWLGDSLPSKMIVIAKPISTNKFLRYGDFSDAAINMRLKNGVNVKLVFSRKCRTGNVEKIQIYGENLHFNSDDFSNKKYLYKDFSIRHKDTYLKCLKKFLSSKNNLFLKEGVNTQKICENALKLASR